VLRRQPDKGQWQNLTPEQSTVGGNDTLLALPGYRGEVRFDNDVGLMLWGNMPYLIVYPLLESAVVLQPAKDAALEFTLDRGRVVLSNHKASGSVKVRVHFNEEKPKPAETWEVTLEDPGTEVALDLLGRYPRDVGFQIEKGPPPRAELYLFVLSGNASVKADASTYQLHAAPGGPSLMSWNNYDEGVHPPGQINPRMLAIWDKAVPSTQGAQDALQALTDLLKRSFENKPIELVVEESLQSDRPMSRILAVYGLGALDATGKVLDALADEDERHGEMRDAAVLALRQWIGRRAENDHKLYETLQQEKHYTPQQAETVMQLLHDLTQEQLALPQTWEAIIGLLRADKPAIRTLAYWHLYRLVPQGQEPKYNPVGDSRQREVAYQAWKALIPDGKLPPTGNQGPGGAPGAPVRGTRPTPPPMK
jgi:hypothetical protein